MDNKTKCLCYESEFSKERFLFDYCPVCKSINLKEVKLK